MASILLVLLPIVVGGALVWTVRVLRVRRGICVDPAERYRREARALRRASDRRGRPGGRSADVWEAGAEPSKAKRATAGFLAGTIALGGCGGCGGCGG